MAAVNAGLILAGLILLELMFGSWFSGSSFGALRIPREVERRYDVSALYPGGGVVDYRRDRWGLRGEYGNPERIEILAVGGSTTAERMVPDGQTWLDRLRQSLAAGGIAVTVANAGIDGQSTIGHIEALRNWLPRIPGLKPSYVLFYVGVNDMQLAPHSEGYDSIVERDPWSALQRRALNDSALANLWRIAAGSLQARRANLEHGAANPAKVPWQSLPIAELPQIDVPEAALVAYERRLQTLITLTRDWGAKPVVITQHRGTYRRVGGRLEFASSASFSGPSDFREMTAFNARALATCRAAKAICVDLDGVDFDVGDFYDYVHTTPSGSARVGRFIAAALAPELRGHPPPAQ